MLFAVAGVSQFRVGDELGSGYIDQTLKKSLITFAVARGLNGVISVAQGTEVALEPGGLGVNLAVGEVLDPINDLVERFSWVMLASSTSLAIQALLLELAGVRVITYGVVGLVGLVTLLAWFPDWVNDSLRRNLTRGLLLFCFVRFTVVAIALVNYQLSAHFLDSKIATSTSALQRTTEQIQQREAEEKIAEVEAAESVVQRLKQFVGDLRQNLDGGQKLAYYQRISAEAVNHLVELAALFLVQTVLMPLLFLWLLIRLLGYLLATK